MKHWLRKPSRLVLLSALLVLAVIVGSNLTVFAGPNASITSVDNNPTALAGDSTFSSGIVPLTYNGAETFGILEPETDFGLCSNLGDNQNSEWFLFDPGSDGVMELSTASLNTNVDTVISVFSSPTADINSFADLTTVACNDNLDPVAPNNRSLITGLPIDGTLFYFVRVSTAFASGSTTLPQPQFQLDIDFDGLATGTPPTFDKAFYAGAAVTLPLADDTPAATLQGGTINTLGFTIVNNAGFVVDDVAFTDDLTALGITDGVPGIAGFSASPTCGTPTNASAGGVINISNIDLAANATCEIIVTFEASNPGTWNNISSPLALGPDFPPATVGDTADATVTVSQQLAVTAVLSQTTAQEGEDITLTLTFSNPNTTQAAQNVTLPLTTGAYNITSINPGGCAPTVGGTSANAPATSDTFSLTFANIAPSGVCVVSIVFEAPAPGTTIDIGPITYTYGGVGQPPVDPAALNVTATEGATPGFVKSFEDLAGNPITSLASGGTGFLSLTIDNSANLFATVENFNLQDALPAPLTVGDLGTNPVAVNTIAGTCAGLVAADVTQSGGGALVSNTSTSVAVEPASAATLAPGDVCEIRVPVTAVVAVDTPLTNTASLAGDLDAGVDLLPTAFTVTPDATDDITITASPVGFSKSFSAATFDSGTTVDLVFTFDNSANAVDLDNIGFTDPLDTVADGTGLVVTGPAVAAGSNVIGCPLATAFEDGAGGALDPDDTTIAIDPADGFSIPAGESCSYTVTVAGVAATTETLENPVGGSPLILDFDLGATPATAAAVSTTVDIVETNPTFTKVFTDFNSGATGTVTFTIDNTGNAAELDNATFADTLPTLTQGASTGLTTTNPGNVTLGVGSDPGCPAAATEIESGGTDIEGAATTFNTISLAPNTIPANAVCIYVVDVTATTDTTQTETNVTVPLSYDLDSAFMGVPFSYPDTADMTTDDVTVTAGAVTFTKSLTDFNSGVVSSVQFIIDNSGNAADLVDVEFVDDLPVLLGSGIVVADPVNVVDEPTNPVGCPTFVGNVFADLASTPLDPGGSTSVAIPASAGVTIPVGLVCAFSVDITAIVDTIQTVNNEPITLDFLLNGVTAATAASVTEPVTVTATNPTFTKVFTPDSFSSGATTQVVFTIDNSGNAAALVNISFTDQLPVAAATGIEVEGVTPVTNISGPPCPDFQAIVTDEANNPLADGDTFIAIDPFAAGGVIIPPGQVCSFSVTVTGTAVGADDVLSNTAFAMSNAVLDTTAIDTGVTFLPITADAPVTILATSALADKEFRLTAGGAPVSTINSGEAGFVVITIDNVANATPLNDISFNETLQGGVVVTNTVVGVQTVAGAGCPLAGAGLNAAFGLAVGTPTIALDDADNIDIPAFTSCEFRIQVSALSPNTNAPTNDPATNIGFPVSADVANNNVPVPVATVIDVPFAVVPQQVVFGKQFEVAGTPIGDGGPMNSGATVDLVFIINNSANDVNLIDFTFTDNLPINAGVQLFAAGPAVVGPGCTGLTAAEVTDGATAVAAGDTVIQVAPPAGASVLAGAICEITVPVTATTIGADVLLSNAPTPALVNFQIEDAAGILGPGPAAPAPFTDSSADANNTEDVLVTQLPVPGFSKVFQTVPQPGPNVPFTLTFNITNTGTTAITGGNFNDFLPTGLTVASITPTNTCAGTPTYTGTGGGALAVGATEFGVSGLTINPGSCSITITVVAPQGTYSNPNALAPTPLQFQSANAPVGPLTPSPVVVNVVGQPLVINKEFLSDLTDPNSIITSAAPGSTVFMRIEIRNPNEATDTNVSFDDDMVGGPASFVQVINNTCGGTLTPASPFPANTASFDYDGGTIGPISVNNGTCVVDLEVLVGASATGQIVNTASNLDSDNFADPANPESTDDAVLNISEVTFNKTFTPNSVVEDTDSTLTITIANTTATAVSNLSFTDDLAAQNFLITGVPISTCPGTVTTTSPAGTLSLTGGSLDAFGGANDSCTISITVTNAVSVVAPTTLLNSTSPLSGDVGSGVQTLAPAVTNVPLTITAAPVAAVQIDKTLTTTDPHPQGGAVTFQIVVNNLAANGATSGVTGVTVTDTFPAEFTGTTVTCLPAGGATCPATPNDLLTGPVTVDIPVDGSVTFTVNGTASGAVGGPYTNSVEVAQGVTVLDTDTQPFNISGAAALTVFKSPANQTVASGSALSFTIQVTNTGLTLADDVDVTDLFTAGLFAAPPTVTCVESSVASSCNNVLPDVADIAAGDTITYTVSGTAGTVGGYTNTANAEGTPSNTVNVTITGAGTPILSLTKTLTSADTVAPGGAVTFNIVVSNTGTADATGVTLTDLFPAEMEAVAVSTTCAAVGAGSTCPAGFPASGDLTTAPFNVGANSGTVTFSVTGQATGAVGGPYSNTADITHPNAPAPDADDTDTFSIASTGVVPAMNLSKAASNPVNAGGPITFTIGVLNTGGIRTVNVSDLIPAQVLSPTWTCFLNFPTNTIPCVDFPNGTGNIAHTITMGAGEQRGYVITGTIDPAAGGTSFSNVVTVTEGANVSTATAPVSVAAPLFTIQKTVTSPATVAPGATVTYEILVQNNSSFPSSNAVVADVFPVELTGVTWTCATTTGAATCTAAGAGNINEPVTLPANSSITFSVTGTVAPITPNGTITNTASLDDDSLAAPLTDDAVFDVNAGATGSVSISKQTLAPTSVFATQQVTFEIRVNNASLSTPATVTIGDVLPAELDAATATWECRTGTPFPGGVPCAPNANGTGNINELVTLAPTENRYYTFTATVVAGTPDGTYNNTATVQPNNIGSTSSFTVVATPIADLGVVKTVDNATPVADSIVTWTVTVTNNGPTALNSVAGDAPIITDVIDVTPYSTVTWTCASTGTVVCPSGAGPFTGDINDEVIGSWPVGDSLEYTITGDLLPAFTGTINNTAAVAPAPSGIPLDNNPANDTDTETATVAATALINVTKTADRIPPTTYAVGEVVTYTFVVENTGSAAYNGLQLNDDFPGQLTGVSTSCTGSTGGAVCPLGTLNGDLLGANVFTFNLPAGGSLTFTATGTVAAGVADNTTVSNTANIFDPGFGVVDSDLEDILVFTPTVVLDVVKDLAPASPATFAAGDPISFTIAVSNTGNSTATGVQLTDVFGAANVTVTSVTCLASGTATCPVTITQGDLNETIDVSAGGTLTFTATGTVNAGTTNGTYTNTVNIAHPSLPTGDSDTADYVVVNPAAAVTLVKDTTNPVSPATVEPGGPVQFSIVVSNTGTAATTVTLTDTFPAQISGITVTCTPTGAGSTCPATPQDLATGSVTFDVGIGGNVTFTVNATVNLGTADGVYTNTASIAALSLTDDSTFEVLNNAILSIDKNTTIPASGAVPGGVPVQFTVLVFNAGSGDATNISLTDVFPAQIENISVTCASTSGGAVCPAPIDLVGGTTFTLPANSSLTFTVDANVVAGTANGTYTNTATINHPSLGAPASDSSDIIVNTPAEGLSAFKSVDQNIIAPNGTVTYTIQLTNTVGALDLTNVSVTDTLPAGFTVVAFNAPTFNPAACGTGPTSALPAAGATGNLTFDGFNIPNGCVVTMTFQATAALTAGTYHNSVLIDETTQPPAAIISDYVGDDPANTAEDVTVSGLPTIRKDFSPGTNPVGGTFAAVFTITAPSGSGFTNYTNISFRDQLPTGVRIISLTPTVNTCGSMVFTGATTLNGTLVEVSGGTLAAGASCQFGVGLGSDTAGTHVNQGLDFFRTAETGDLPSTVLASVTIGGDTAAGPAPAAAAPDRRVTDGCAFVRKSVDRTIANIGNTLTYTITFTNPRTVPLTNVVISDQFDARLTGIRVVSNSVGTPNVTGNLVNLTGFQLQPGQSGTLVITAVISNSARAGDVIRNTASLESPDASIHFCAAVETAISPTVLPGTGEAPLNRWRLPIALLTAVTLAMLAYVFVKHSALLRRSAR